MKPGKAKVQYSTKDFRIDVCELITCCQVLVKQKSMTELSTPKTKFKAHMYMVIQIINTMILEHVLPENVQFSR